MKIHCWARCQRRLGGNTGYSLTLTYTKTTDRQYFLLYVSCCCVHIFPIRIISIFFSSPYLLYEACPSVWDTISVPVQLSPPSHALSGAPMLHIAQISTLHLCFVSFCVSTTSPPSGAFINYTVETEDIKTSQTHLPVHKRDCYSCWWATEMHKRGEKKKINWGQKLHKDKVTLEEILDLQLSQSPYRNITPKPCFLPK